MAAQNGVTIEGMNGGVPGVRQFGLNTNQAVDFSGASSVALPSTPTANSIIIPIYEVIGENQNQLAAASFAVTHTLFVNDNVSGTYKIAGGSVVWSTASSSGIVKLGVATGTTAPGSGTSQTSTGIDTSTTANTTNNFVITTATTITAGSRVELVWSGTVTSLAGCTISIVLQRLS